MKLKFFSTDFQKILKYQISSNRLVGAELFHADGQTERQTDKQTDMTNLIVAFRHFANWLKNDS